MTTTETHSIASNEDLEPPNTQAQHTAPPGHHPTIPAATLAYNKSYLQTDHILPRVRQLRARWLEHGKPDSFATFQRRQSCVFDGLDTEELFRALGYFYEHPEELLPGRKSTAEEWVEGRERDVRVVFDEGVFGGERVWRNGGEREERKGERDGDGDGDGGVSLRSKVAVVEEVDRNREGRREGSASLS